MRRVLGFAGATLGGAAGWWAGSGIGILTAFTLGVVGSAIGMYGARRFADHYGY